MWPLTGSFRPPFFPFTAASFRPSLSVCLSLAPPAKARTPLLLESLDISDSKHNFSPRWTIRVPRDSSVVTESSCLIEISYSLTYYLRKPYLRHAWPVQPRRQTSWKLPTGRVDPLHISPPLHSPCSANCFPSLTLENRLKGKLLLLHFLHEFTVEYFDRSIRLNWIKLTGCVYAYVCKLLGIASE